MGALTQVVTTKRTKEFIRTLQDGRPISASELQRIKNKYFSVLFETLRFQFTGKNMKYNKERLSQFSEKVIDDVFGNIKNDKWSGVSFRAQLKLRIEDTVTARLFKKEPLPVLSDQHRDFIDDRQYRIEKANLTDKSAEDLLLHIIRHFVLPDLREENELYHNVLHLKDINKLKDNEVAIELGIKPDYVRQVLRRARVKFTKLLNEHIAATPLLDNPDYDKKRLLKILPLLKKE